MTDLAVRRPLAFPVGRLLAGLAVVLGLLALFAVAFDQGQLLSPLVAKAASSNYLHELFHDGRHLLGVPCH